MKKILFIAIMILSAVISAVSYAFEENTEISSTPQPHISYTFDSKNVIDDEGGCYTIIDKSGGGFNAGAKKDEISRTEDGIKGKFTIPSQAFTDTTSFTMNFHIRAEHSGLNRRQIIDFGDVAVYSLGGSGVSRICSYYEKEIEKHSIQYDNSFEPNSMNMYTIVKDGENIRMYINGGLNTTTWADEKSGINFCDIAADGKDFIMSVEDIKEFSFYNTVLSAENIAMLYAGSEEIYPYKINAISVVSASGEILESVPEKGGFIAEVSIDKAAERDDADYLFVGVYGVDGELLSLDYVRAKFMSDGECAFGFYVPEMSVAVGSIKAYVWDDFNSMKPLAESKSIVF